MNKIKTALELAKYHAATHGLKPSHRLMIAIDEAWEEIYSISPETPIAKQEKKPFEYENKLEWCPEIKGFTAYVLILSNGHMYKGHTGNFKQRMLQHFNGFGGHTTKRNRPVYILHHEQYDSKKAATAREKFFKSTDGYNWIKSYSFLKTIKPNTL